MPAAAQGLRATPEGALRPLAAWACGLAVPVDNWVAHRYLHNPSGCAQGPQATITPPPRSFVARVLPC